MTAHVGASVLGCGAHAHRSGPALDDRLHGVAAQVLLLYCSIQMLQWNPPQRDTVSACLARFPPESAKCAAAARAILPTARERDSGAHAVQLRPNDGSRFIETTTGRCWYHHVTVSLEHHRLDALTGANGHPSGSYLQTYFLHQDFIAETDIGDASSVDPGIQDGEV